MLLHVRGYLSVLPIVSIRDLAHKRCAHGKEDIELEEDREKYGGQSNDQNPNPGFDYRAFASILEIPDRRTVNTTLKHNQWDTHVSNRLVPIGAAITESP